jgi:hypothetical protein
MKVEMCVISESPTRQTSAWIREVGNWGVTEQKPVFCQY